MRILRAGPFSRRHDNKAGANVAKKKEEKAPPAEGENLDAAEAKPSKKKLIIKIVILVVLLALLGGGGFFGYKMFFAKKKAAEGDNATEQKTEEKADANGEKKAEGGDKKEGGKEGGGAGPEGGSELVSIPPLLVNLSEPQGRRYLKLALDVEVKDKLAADALNKNMAKVKDALLLLLSSKTYDDLASIESKILLKKEIVERLTLVLGEQKVLRVYITEIVIQ